MKTHPPAFRRKVVRAYKNGRGSIYQVAKKYGVSTLQRWLQDESGASAKSAAPDDFQLTGGRWVNDRGVQRWERIA